MSFTIVGVYRTHIISGPGFPIWRRYVRPMRAANDDSIFGSVVGAWF